MNPASQGPHPQETAALRATFNPQVVSYCGTAGKRRASSRDPNRSAKAELQELLAIRARDYGDRACPDCPLELRRELGDGLVAQRCNAVLLRTRGSRRIGSCSEGRWRWGLVRLLNYRLLRAACDLLTFAESLSTLGRLSGQ